MRLVRVQNSFHSMYLQAKALYEISFPFHEQREAFSQDAILQNDAYHFDLVYDGETFVGLILYWEYQTYIYVEHFCILPEMRNNRYGQRVLELMKEKDKTLILEIDPPVDTISIKRKGFYERCGFVENPYTHVHPPYHRDHKGHDLVIMSCPAPISPSEYDMFFQELRDTIMNNVF